MTTIIKSSKQNDYLINGGELMHLKLKEIRESKGITQEFMAGKLGYKHKSGYNKLEIGQRKISIEQAKVISELLEKSIEEIFF